MTGSVVQLSGKALQAEFASFIGGGLTHSRDLGRGDGEFVASPAIPLALGGALTAATRPETTGPVAKGPSNRFQGLNS